MDQVGFEPTSSRVVGEVTLSFTTSNSIAFRQIRAGRKIEQSSRTTVPRRFTDEVTLLRTIPADPMGTIGPRLIVRAIAPCEAGGFRCRISPVARSALLAEVTRTFTTSVLLWRESAARDFSSAALPLSYGGFRNRWESNPRHRIDRSNPFLHHATNFSSILRYISMFLFLSFEHAHP